MSSGAAKRLAAYWDWKAGAEVPDARIVVCAPGFDADASVRAMSMADVYVESGGALVCDAFMLLGGLTIPGLYVTSQSEIELKALAPFFRLPSQRRALVCSPTEPIDLRWTLRPDLARYSARDEFERHGRWGGCGFCPLDGDGRRDPRACERSSESDHRLTNEWVDVVFVVGLDKPVHPEWVRSIVEQCRAASVPVVFLTWGAWVPREAQTDAAKAFVKWQRDWNTGPRICGGARLGTEFYLVGAERSGALLDGVLIEDVPAWLGGAR